MGAIGTSNQFTRAENMLIRGEFIILNGNRFDAIALNRLLQVSYAPRHAQLDLLLEKPADWGKAILSRPKALKKIRGVILKPIPYYYLDRKHTQKEQFLRDYPCGEFCDPLRFGTNHLIETIVDNYIIIDRVARFSKLEKLDISLDDLGIDYVIEQFSYLKLLEENALSRLCYK
jgi:hypothetical protein